VQDDLGFRHQDIHEVTPRHEVKQEVQVVLVLEGGVLAYAEGVGGVLGDDLAGEKGRVEGGWRGEVEALKLVRGNRTLGPIE
jgi:hypothetical protein